MNHIYQDQPLFIHIHNLLSKTGSKLYVPTNVETWKPLACHYFPQQKWGQQKQESQGLSKNGSHFLLVDN